MWRIHDSTVSRTTNGSGEVHEFTLEELRQVDAGMWFDREFMGERVPTLEEILEFSREHDVVFYLELKYPAVWGMDHSLVAALQKAQSAPRTIVISFDPATLSPLRRLDPSIMTGLLVEDAKGNCIQEALDLGVRQLCPKVSSVTPELVGAGASRRPSTGDLDRQYHGGNAGDDGGGSGRNHDRLSRPAACADRRFVRPLNSRAASRENGYSRKAVSEGYCSCLNSAAN